MSFSFILVTEPVFDYGNSCRSRRSRFELLINAHKARESAKSIFDGALDGRESAARHDAPRNGALQDGANSRSRLRLFFLPH